MTKLELLKKYENMASHNLFCYSRNLGMTEPKEGFERQWKQAKEECKLLEEMMKEVTQEVPVLGQMKMVTVCNCGIRSLGKLFMHNLLHDYLGSKLKIQHVTNDRILIFDLNDRFIGEATA